MKMTLQDVLDAVDPKVLEGVDLNPNYARLMAYDTIDRIPAKWGTWGKLAFHLFVRAKLREQVDRWIAGGGKESQL